MGEVAVMTLQELKKESRWLNQFASDTYSQTGEDGIIARALEVLPSRNHWCVEFGAWDGKHLSNTFNLVENKGYRVVLIEGDPAKYQSLRREYPYGEQAIFVGQFVGWTGADTLDAILAAHPIPRDFDLLSIDIDGNDYHVWKAVTNYRPRLVLIEFNPTSSNRFDYVQPPHPSLNQSNSPAALVRLGKEKGYELICVVGPNLLFVDRQYVDLFHIPDNSLEVMRDEDEVNHLFLGFDGSLILDGPSTLRWHNLELKLKQPFPAAIRKYPPAYNRWRGLLFRLWRFLHYRVSPSGDQNAPMVRR